VFQCVSVRVRVNAYVCVCVLSVRNIVMSEFDCVHDRSSVSISLCVLMCAECDKIS
jgi:hypothetical protein